MEGCLSLAQRSIRIFIRLQQAGVRDASTNGCAFQPAWAVNEILSGGRADHCQASILICKKDAVCRLAHQLAQELFVVKHGFLISEEIFRQTPVEFGAPTNVTGPESAAVSGLAETTVSDSVSGHSCHALP